jgi:hypothetical protein
MHKEWRLAPGSAKPTRPSQFSSCPTPSRSAPARNPTPTHQLSLFGTPLAAREPPRRPSPRRPRRPRPLRAQRRDALRFLEAVVRADPEYKALHGIGAPTGGGKCVCAWLDEAGVLEDLFGERAHATIVSETAALLALIELNEVPPSPSTPFRPIPSLLPPPPPLRPPAPQPTQSLECHTPPPRPPPPALRTRGGIR